MPTVEKIGAMQLTLTVRQMWAVVTALAVIAGVFFGSAWKIMGSAAKVQQVVDSAWTVQDMDSYGREWAQLNKSDNPPDALNIYLRNRQLSSPGKTSPN